MSFSGALTFRASPKAPFFVTLHVYRGELSFEMCTSLCIAMPMIMDIDICQYAFFIFHFQQGCGFEYLLANA